MLYLIKTLIAALIIVAVGEVSRRSSVLAAFLLALPIVSITALVWIYIESKDKVKIADISYETFWYVIPTLPMFILLSWMRRRSLSRKYVLKKTKCQIWEMNQALPDFAWM